MYQFEIESIKKEAMNFGEQNIQVVFKTIARCLCPHNFLRSTSPQGLLKYTEIELGKFVTKRKEENKEGHALEFQWVGERTKARYLKEKNLLKVFFFPSSILNNRKQRHPEKYFQNGGETSLKETLKTKGMRPIWFQNAQQTAIVNDPGKHTQTHTHSSYTTAINLTWKTSSKLVCVYV